MINANELRIGNFVLDNNIQRKVLGIKKDDIGDVLLLDHKSTNRLLKNINSIPLTPEILVACGFKKEIRGEEDDFDGPEIVYHLDGVDIYDHRECGGNFSYATYTRYPGRGFKGGRIVDYLHQLQNLYFALTGKELEINL